jgi:foldase protein PrsA
MKVTKVISALGAFFVLAVGLAACGGGVPGNSVAVMAGNPITMQTFNHWLYVAAKGQSAQNPSAPVIVPNDPPSFANCIAQVRKQIPSLAKTPDATVKSDCAQLFTSLSGQVMDFLIKAYWYQAAAAKLGIKVSDQEVQKNFQQAKAQQFPTEAQFQAFLKQTGQTTQDILFRVRINAIFKKLLARYSAPVSDAQVQAYYQAHLSQFGTPATVDLHFVRTKTLAGAQAAKAALAAHHSWNAVAKKYSLDQATKNTGGVLTGVTKGQEEAAFNNAIFAAQASKVYGPIKGQFGYYVFEVTKTKKATQQPLSLAATQIKGLLTQEQQTTAQTKLDAKAKADWFKQTTCRHGYAMADCVGYKPPRATTPPVTPTQAPPTTTAPPTGTTSTTTK